VSWRRVSAEARFEIEAARSRRRRAVEESTASRSGSVRCWDVGGGECAWRVVVWLRRCGAVVVR
jgi:hypothetical protein